MLALIFHEFCRILNSFCLLCHILCRNNINYAKLSYSDVQLPAYTTYRSLQKTKTLVVRHLTRPYSLEICGGEVLLCRCHTTKEASQFRNKVVKTILAEKNIETFNTFIGYTISLKLNQLVLK